MDYSSSLILYFLVGLQLFLAKYPAQKLSFVLKRQEGKAGKIYTWQKSEAISFLELQT
jgi:hypothetical protein